MHRTSCSGMSGLSLIGCCAMPLNAERVRAGLRRAVTLLIAGASMAFAVHQWSRGYHLLAIGFITFACLMAGVAVETAKNNSAPPVFGSQ